MSLSVEQALQAAEQAAGSQSITQASLENLKPWLTQDYLAEYREAILETIAAEKWEEIDAAFWEVVPFGTGGRRGPMGPFGTATINTRTVAESAYGLGSYLLSTNGNTGGKAVIACDTRNRSLEFSKLTACVLAAQGLTVYYHSAPRSTPQLSFAVRHLGCDVGAMVSASHNPPSDNGFKAYWSHGGQVLAPHDKGIIDCVYASKEIPVLDFEAAVSEGKIIVLDEQIDHAYHNAVLEKSLSQSRSINAIFTPLHGVGGTSCYEILKKAGFDSVSQLEIQSEQNGNFPNVDQHFPNPERREVFDPAIAAAKQSGESLILASDPDADRLGVMVKASTGDWEHLTGNRIGVLLADYILRKRTEAGTLSPDSYLVETLVTTPLISELAKAYNAKCHDQLLVGFKYIGQTMDEQGPENFVFGAEESLGYLAGSYARDKDAGIAALYLCELASELKDEGKTLIDRLNDIYASLGYYTEGQFSKVCTGPSGKQQIQELIAALRSSPPQTLAGQPMTQVNDYGIGEIRSLPQNSKSAAIESPRGELMFFSSAEGDQQVRVAVRPSGTEPKIKFYLYAQAAQSAESAELHHHAEIDELLKKLKVDLTSWIDEQLS